MLWSYVNADGIMEYNLKIELTFDSTSGEGADGTMEEDF